MSQLTIDRPSTLVLSPSRTTLDDVWNGVRGTTDLEDSNVLLVVYGHSPGAVRDAWRRRVDGVPARLGVIGVGAPDRDGDGEPVATEGSDVLSVVRDPDDASDLGIALSLYLQDWATESVPTTLGFHSLTEMLDHVGVETTFRFLHVLNHRLSDTETSGRFYLDPTAVDESTVETLRPLFTDVIEREPPAEEPLDPEVAFDLVGVERRRYVLYHLLENREGTSVEALAAAVAQGEGVLDHEAVELSLRHAHLPKLEDADLVSVDSDRLVPQGSLAAIEPYLAPAVDYDLSEDESPL